jgi:hypothetical protein
MKRSDRFVLTAALLVIALQMVAPGGRSAAHAAPVAPCDLRLRVELTPDVPYPRDAGFVSSLLGNHLEYQLTLLRQDPEDSSAITLDLTGPGPLAGCRDVVSSLRKDARVASVEVQPVAARAALPVMSPALAPGNQPVSTVQPMGTLQAGPDGDWVLKRSSDVSYAQQARVRYECDISAVDQTGFDPTEDDGGVPPDEVAGKRAAYLRAEAACFEAHGYIVR